MDYQRARDANETLAWIDGRPYLPQIRVLSSDATATQASVQRAAATLLLVWQSARINNRRDSTLPSDTVIDRLACRLHVEHYDGGVTNTLYKVTLIENGDTQDDDTASTVSEKQCLTANDLDQLLKYCVHCTTKNDQPNSNPSFTSTSIPSTSNDQPNSNLSSTSPVPSTSPVVLLVRVFGAEGMIDRDLEASIFAALSSTRAPLTRAPRHSATTTIAPPYYGRLGNGRVEGWMPHMRPLHTSELPHFAPGIAHAMAVLHVGFTLDTMEPTPTVFHQLDQWLDRAQHLVSTTCHERLVEWIPHLRDELAWLQSLVSTRMGHDTQAIVFCHNDLLAANILCVDESTTNESARPTDHDADAVQLIDFEYGGINYRALDMANHFNEYAGGPPDCAIPNYAHHLPTPSQQRVFIECYLQATRRIRRDQHQQRRNESNATSDTPDPNDDGIVSELEIDALMGEVELFLLVNHLYWGLWAVNQGGGCPITTDADGYDYTTYAIQRIQQYWLDKANYQAKMSL